MKRFNFRFNLDFFCKIILLIFLLQTQVCKSAIRVVGYYLDHTIKNDIKVENEYVSVLAKVKINFYTKLNK